MDVDNFQENIAIRNLKYVESKEQNEYEDEEEDDEY